MSVVGGLDIHRKQITFDYLDVDSGQLWRGQIAPADRAHLAALLRERFDPARHGLVGLAVEACTGWRYVAEELARAGVVAHLGEPAETAALRGPSGAPRPTGLMLAICGSCWPLGGCRSVGSRRRMCWSAGRCWRPIMRCGWSTLPGSSGCTRCCFTRAPLGWVRGRFPPPRGWRGLSSCASSSCRRRAGCRSPVGWPCSVLWTPSLASCATSSLTPRGACTAPGCCTGSCMGLGRSGRWRSPAGWGCRAVLLGAQGGAVLRAGRDGVVVCWQTQPRAAVAPGPGVLRWLAYEAGKTHARTSPLITTTTPRSRTASTANARPWRRPASWSAEQSTSWMRSATTPWPGPKRAWCTLRVPPSRCARGQLPPRCCLTAMAPPGGAPADGLQRLSGRLPRRAGTTNRSSCRRMTGTPGSSADLGEPGCPACTTRPPPTHPASYHEQTHPTATRLHPAATPPVGLPAPPPDPPLVAGRVNGAAVRRRLHDRPAADR